MSPVEYAQSIINCLEIWRFRCFKDTRCLTEYLGAPKKYFAFNNFFDSTLGEG